MQNYHNPLGRANLIYSVPWEQVCQNVVILRRAWQQWSRNWTGNCPMTGKSSKPKRYNHHTHVPSMSCSNVDRTAHESWSIPWHLISQSNTVGLWCNPLAQSCLKQFRRVHFMALNLYFPRQNYIQINGITI